MLTLRNLKKTLISQKKITMPQLKIQFNSDEEDIYQMLQFFIGRGNLEEISLTSKCGTGCKQCAPLSTLKFQWIEK